MVAKLSAYSDRSVFMRRRELTHEQLDDLKVIARRELPLVAGFPHPKIPSAAPWPPIRP